jgi:hypothetical protein
VGRAKLRDVGVVADAFEPFGHRCDIFALLAELRDRLLNDANRSAESIAQSRGGVLHANGVTRDVDRCAAEPFWLCEGAVQTFGASGFFERIRAVARG